MLAVNLLGSALSSYARALLLHGEYRAVTPILTAAHTLYLVAHLAASGVWIGLCASLAALPAWVGARRAARAALGLAVVELVEPLVGSVAYAVYYGAVSAVGAVVHTAYVLLLATALERATTAVDRSRPARLVPWALFASALAFGAMLSGAFTALLGLMGAWVLAVGFAFHGALASLLAWGWARGLKTASAVLGPSPTAAAPTRRRHRGATARP
jgi:hypothetical protein